MKVLAVVPVPLGALLISWAVGWSLGVLILIAAGLSLSFGVAFWWAWDALKAWREERAFCCQPGRHATTSLQKDRLQNALSFLAF
jgi:hypothetical protein